MEQDVRLPPHRSEMSLSTSRVSRVDFGLAISRSQFVQYAVDVFVAVDTAEGLGQFDRFVDDDLVGDFQVVLQLISADQQGRMLNWRQLVDGTVDQGSKTRTQFGDVLDDTMQDGIEMLGIGLVETMGFADVGVDNAGIFVIEQPFVDALQREFASAVSRRAVFIGIGVDGFFGHGLLNVAHRAMRA